MIATRVAIANASNSNSGGNSEGKQQYSEGDCRHKLDSNREEGKRQYRAVVVKAINSTRRVIAKPTRTAVASAMDDAEH